MMTVLSIICSLLLSFLLTTVANAQSPSFLSRLSSDECAQIPGTWVGNATITIRGKLCKFSHFSAKVLKEGANKYSFDILKESLSTDASKGCGIPDPYPLPATCKEGKVIVSLEPIFSISGTVMAQDGHQALELSGMGDSLLGIGTIDIKMEKDG